MSYLTGILNPDEVQKHHEVLTLDADMLDEQMSSSPEDEDDMTPGSDEEIDELEDESDEDDDYTERSPGAMKRSGAHDSSEGGDENVLEGVRTDGIHRLGQDQEKPDKPRKPPAPRKKAERHDRRIDLGLLDHKAHPDCPDTLGCLPDTNGRPQHTLPVILRCAILGSPRKRLTIREIYATMEAKYPYYKTAGQTWKQSVRHHLSLNRLFERQPRPVTDPGFGSYWTVNLLAPPGTKRPRKRGRQNKSDPSKSTSPKEGEGTIIIPQPTKFQFQPQSHPPPPPPPLPEPQVKSFNNPRAPHQYQPSMGSIPSPPPSSSSSQAYPVHDNSRQLSPRHARHSHLNHKPHMQHHSHSPYSHKYSHHSNGNVHNHHSHHASHSPQHPRQPHSRYSHSEHEGERQRSLHRFRSASPGTPTSGHGSGSIYPPSSRDSDPDDLSMTMQEDTAPFATVSDDEFESEEETSRGQHRRTSLQSNFIPTRPSSIFSLPTFNNSEKSKEDIIEHMRQEIATLRRTSAEAVSTSIRLSEQLANANLEVARSREAMRDLEDMVQDEVMKRRDADRQKEIEADRRRAAEQALSSLAIRSPARMRT
ncbi:hypothetical protein CPB83DRAFT_848085 [Crepidotus variabilis]|uniref:Fork-head domain-containing protein n=1 Tax=Crepidotus variabilis TaxID=179855 RepID=A0A9P6JTN5_9AGAR|nr:hypothetical protein CPB83DRAFT_848085 [Crepidotus variabilis]